VFSLEIIIDLHKIKYLIYNKKGERLTGLVNCPLKHATEGQRDGWMEVKVRRGRRSRQLLDDT
jgi:hypothetical protein